MSDPVGDNIDSDRPCHCRPNFVPAGSGSASPIFPGVEIRPRPATQIMLSVVRFKPRLGRRRSLPPARADGNHDLGPLEFTALGGFTRVLGPGASPTAGSVITAATHFGKLQWRRMLTCGIVEL